MRRIDARDAGRVGRFLLEIGEIDGEVPFPAELLAALGRLVPSDEVGFSELDRVHQRELGAVVYPEFDDVPEPAVSYWEIRDEHPLCRAQELTGDFGARRITDFLPLPKLRHTRLYRDWFKPFGVEYELTAGIDSPLWHTKVFVLVRYPGRDFSDRDVAVLEAVRPGLAERYELWQSRRRLGDVLALVESRDGSVVLLDGADRVAFATDPASALLERYAGSVDGVLPAEIVTWLRAGSDEPLEVRSSDGTLLVRAVGGALLLEERPAGPGLTPREREIVELVAEGLTNAQIAERLWISPGTVRRHLENIYEKLGVRTRTAAVRAAGARTRSAAGTPA